MRPIKELAPGDEVFSLDEATKAIVVAGVVGHRCSGEKEIFEITARGRKIGASSNHPFLALRDERREGAKHARFRARWVPVEDLEMGDLVAIATDVPDYGRARRSWLPQRREAAGFPTATTDDLCWWAGDLPGRRLPQAGPYPVVEIAVDRTDEELVEEIRRVTRELFGIELSLAVGRFSSPGEGNRGPRTSSSRSTAWEEPPTPSGSRIGASGSPAPSVWH